MLVTWCLVADAGVVECVGLNAKVSLSVMKLEMLLRGDVDFCTTNEAEVVIVTSC
jgi:hypothetical protein